MNGKGQSGDGAKEEMDFAMQSGSAGVLQPSDIHSRADPRANTSSNFKDPEKATPQPFALCLPTKGIVL